MTKDIVSIIIPCFNAIKYTKQCLDSIFNNTTYNYELILINNGSSDGTGKYLKSLNKKTIKSKYLKKLTILQFKKNLGVAKSLNLGISKSIGRYICYVNNDVILSSNWLNSLVKKVKENSKIAIVGTLFNAFEDKKFVKIVEKDKDEISKVANYIYIKNKDKIKKAKTIHGLCMLIRKSIFNKVGLFNENFYPCFGEDIEFCKRVKENNFLLIDALDVFVFHYWNKSVRSKQFNKENNSIDDVMNHQRKNFSIPSKYRI